MDLNVNNLSVDKNGRVSFSGLGSNIDFQGVIDSIVAAKRIPIDRLETEVSTNESKIAALGDLRTLLTVIHWKYFRRPKPIKSRVTRFRAQPQRWVFRAETRSHSP